MVNNILSKIFSRNIICIFILSFKDIFLCVFYNIDIIRTTEMHVPKPIISLIYIHWSILITAYWLIALLEANLTYQCEGHFTIYIHIHTPYIPHVYIHTTTHTHTCMCIYTTIHVHTYIYVHTYTCVHATVCSCVCIYVL